MDFKWIADGLVDERDIFATKASRRAEELCEAFDAERITIYRVASNGSALEAIVQYGLEHLRTLKLPLAGLNPSISAYVAAQRRLVNVTDAYDDSELAAYEPPLRFLREVDKRSGIRTRQVLAAPILARSGKVLGVVQVINRLDNRRFPKECESGLVELCAKLGPVFERRWTD